MLCSTATWNSRNKLFIYCMIQKMSTAKNTRQLLRNKPKKHLTFQTRNRLHVQCFRIMVAGIASWDNYLIHDKWKNSKNQPLPIVLFTDVALNWIKKGIWFTLCYFIKFNNKPIFDYQNMHLLYRSVWIKLDTKWHHNGYNKIIVRLWSANCGSRIEWEASKKDTKFFYYGCSKSWLKKECREHIIK